MSNRDTIYLEGDATSIIAALAKASKRWKDYNEVIARNAALQREAQNIFGKTASHLANTKDGMNDATKATAAFNISLKSMGKLVAVQLTHRAISAFVRQMSEGVKEAIKLEKALSEVRTISQDNQLTMDQWFEGVKGLSNSFGTDIGGQVEAAYQTISNQVASGAETFTFLEEANRFAAAAVTDTSTAVNLLTAAINAYGKDAGDARNISAMFFKTIELGRVRASEMANSFGDISVQANQLGIELHELLGIVSTLTIQGIKYNKAATQLRGIFSKLLKPTEAMKELFKEWEVANGQAAITTFGTIGVLEKLHDAIGGNAEVAAKLFPRQRALTGVLAALGDNFGRLKDNVDATGNAAKSFDVAVTEMLNNTGTKAEIAGQRIKNGFLDVARDSLVDIVAIIGKVSGIYDDIEKERKKADMAGKFKREANDLNNAYEVALKGRLRMYDQEVSAVAKAISKQVGVRVKGLNEVHDETVRINKAVLRSVTETIKEGTERYDQLSKNVVDANKRIIDLVRDEDQTLFQWSQGTKNTAQQIEGILARITELKIKQNKAHDEGNRKLAAAYNKDIMGLIDSMKGLDDELLKSNTKAHEDKLKKAREIEKVESEAATKVLALREKMKGTRGGERSKIAKEIHDLESETLEEVKSLREEYNKIVELERKRYDFSNLRKAETKRQIEQNKEIARVDAAKAAQLKKDLILQEVQRDKLKDSLSSFRKLDTRGDLDSNDPEKLKRSAEMRVRILKDIADASKALGVDPAEFSKANAALQIGSALLKERAATIEENKIKRTELTEANTKAIESEKKLTAEIARNKAALALTQQLMDELPEAINDRRGPGQTSDIQASYKAILGIVEKLKKGTLDSKDAMKQLSAEAKFLNTQNLRSPILFDETITKEMLKPGDIASLAQRLALQLRNAEELDKKSLATQLKLMMVNTIISDTTIKQKTQNAVLGQQKTKIDSNADSAYELFEINRDILLLYQMQNEELNKQKPAPVLSPQSAPQNQAPVQNKSLTNVGDIKVNLNATGNLNYDAAQIGREIKRAVRRGIV